MKKTPDNLSFALSGLAVPLGFNVPDNRYPLSVSCSSACASAQVWFYEYHGLFWYSVAVEKLNPINSIGFLSIQSCILEFREFLRGYGFSIVDKELVESRLRGLRRISKPPKSWRV